MTPIVSVSECIDSRLKILNGDFAEGKFATGKSCADDCTYGRYDCANNARIKQYFKQFHICVSCAINSLVVTKAQPHHRKKRDAPP